MTDRQREPGRESQGERERAREREPERESHREREPERERERQIDREKERVTSTKEGRTCKDSSRWVSLLWLRLRETKPCQGSTTTLSTQRKGPR